MVGEKGVLPFRQFVLKIHSRCDLACDHCYVYEHADQSWRGRPLVIAQETVAAAGAAIATHARDHQLSEVRVILHGGEPLLGAVDIRSDPVAVYRALAELEPPNLDFLFPHGTWDEPPPGVGGTRYADWLGPVNSERMRDAHQMGARG
jgi:hypothetical protein